VLRQEAVKAGFSEETVRDLTWLLNAYCHLTEFPRIGKNLLQMLDLIPAKWQIPLDVMKLESWPSLLRWMGEHRQELSGSIPAFSAFQDTPTPGKPFTGRVREKESSLYLFMGAPCRFWPPSAVLPASGAFSSGSRAGHAPVQHPQRL